MSRLTIYPDDQSAGVKLDTQEATEIAASLAKIGVRFERWETQDPLPQEADDEAVMDAYAKDIERLKNENGYQSVDVVRLSPEHPKKDEFRQKFLSEHTHGEDEVRFFVEGAGVFYLRHEGQVYRTLCTSGDLISVPAGVKHWFDMGPAPSFTCIRLFTTLEGWIAEFTGDQIAEKFPKFDQRVA